MKISQERGVQTADACVDRLRLRCARFLLCAARGACGAVCGGACWRALSAKMNTIAQLMGTRFIGSTFRTSGLLNQGHGGP